MSNVNEKTNPQGGDLSNLKRMFADYQKKQSQANKKMASRGNILSKYFVPRNTKETFRILPPKQGRKHIEEAYFHVVTTNIAGGVKKHGTILYCPAHNDPRVPKIGSDGKPMLDQNNNPILVPAPCPLCAKYKKLLTQQDPSLIGVKKDEMNDVQKRIKAKNDEIYKEAIKWEAKKFYIVRGIDKGAEKDGVKFWRFKHNYKNQGTLDKLLPILEDYMVTNQSDFSDPHNGTDLNIIMTDSEFNGRVYKAISAITARGKSKLSQDPIVMKQWLDDDIMWRDVFLPKKAPNITPFEFLEMVASGTNPYWNDIDSKNKRWVFPSRPDLEEMANTRKMNLDSKEDENFEYASDLEDVEYPRVTISNIKESDIGTYDDDATDLGTEIIDDENPSDGDDSLDDDDNSSVSLSDDNSNFNYDDESDDYDDLPF